MRFILNRKSEFIINDTIVYPLGGFYVNLRVEVAAVSRNIYGVEKTVDPHKILINAIQFYVCLQEI